MNNKNFITLEELSKLLNCNFIGNKDYKIYGIKTLRNAKENFLILQLNEELTYKKIEYMDIDAVYLTKSKVIYPKNKNFLIYNEDLQLILFNILEIFFQKNIKFNINYENKINTNNIGNNVCIGNNCYIGENVYIGNNVTIQDNVYIGSNCYIGNNVCIYNNTKILDNVTIYDNCCLGIESFMFFEFDNKYKKCKSIGGLIIEDNVEIGYNCTIEKGLFENTKICENCKIGNLVHIGHDTYISKNCIIMTQTGIASFVNIEKNVIIYAKCGISNFVYIGDNSRILAGSMVTKNFKQGSTIFGYPAQHKEVFLKQLSFIKKQYNKYKRR